MNIFCVCLFFFSRRESLPSKMVPRDEVGLWSILKHCIGKELSKITIPVIFNEPISFLQRLTEMLHYSEYLNIADQCTERVERLEVNFLFFSLCFFHVLSLFLFLLFPRAESPYFYFNTR